ncbi:MAG: GTP-binding protein [Hyphomicrobiaceae bacterium]
MTPIPVTVLTGFLGAGKTSLLNALLRDPAFAKTAVLINEFGDVPIDHDLVATFSDQYVTTTTGCLCCTASSEIKESLFDLWMRRTKREVGPFRRVIVETTGLADPAPVINSLLAPGFSFVDRTVDGQFALSRVITLFDIVNGDVTLDAHFEAVKQVALADALIMTKADLANDPATKRDIASSRSRLALMNPAARILDRHTDWCEIRALLLKQETYDLRTKGEDAIAWLRAEATSAALDHKHHHGSHSHHHADRNRHGDDIRCHVLFFDEPITPVAFYFFLDVLKMGAGADLLRVKGLVALTDDPSRPAIVHGVQHVIHLIDRLECWPSDDRRTRLVIIGRNLDIEAMRSLLMATRPKMRGAAAWPEKKRPT